MAVLNYRDLIVEELSMSDAPVSLDFVDTHWERFASQSPLEKQYLLTKRAVARTLLAKARKKVDTQIGFDQIKASQMVSNLEKIIKDINDEIEEQFPEVTDTSSLTTLSPELGLYSEE
jgi:hypothetical protein